MMIGRPLSAPPHWTGRELSLTFAASLSGASMAEAKKGLSDSYHAHKRTTLLTSGALFLASLPGVKISATLFGVLSAGPIPDFARLVLFAAASYYFANFVAIWMVESGPYVRAEDYGETEFRKVLEPHLAEVTQAAARVMDASASIERNAAALLSGDASNPVALDVDLLHKTLSDVVRQSETFIRAEYLKYYRERLHGWLMQALPDLSNVQPLELYNAMIGFPDHPEVLMGLVPGQTIASILEREPDFAIRTNGLQAIKHQVAGTLEQTRKDLDQLTRQIIKIRRSVSRGPFARRALLWGIDLSAPMLVYAIALAHLLGRKWPIFWDAVTLCRHLTLIG
jgi:hypothetical protein